VIRVDPRKSTPAKRSPLSYPLGVRSDITIVTLRILAKSPANAPTLTHDVIIVATCTCRRTANERSNDGADDHMLWELFAFSHETLAHKRLLTRRWSWLLTQLP
jgi:hypothetical protein